MQCFIMRVRLSVRARVPYGLGTEKQNNKRGAKAKKCYPGQE